QKFPGFNLVQFELDQVKTREFLKVLKSLNRENALIVTEKEDKNLELSSRNFPGAKVLRCEGLNVYDILKYKDLILLESSISGIERRLLA
ncbi:MAG TPA: 50S ribosomal protein L4, partial [Desulfobacteraceae bacterium]|nr:50S ribosomal protein L4 [Desulfobacteraceae bacterium]